MSTKAFIFLTFLLINISYELGTCDSKKIVQKEGDNSYSLVAKEISGYLVQDDIKKAFYKSSSCASLYTNDNYNSLCCYMKVKYKLDEAKTHYTSKGCVEVSFTDLQSGDSFGSMKRGYEDGIKNYYANNANSTVSDVDVDIDCNSKFIKVTALAFLMFLL